MRERGHGDPRRAELGARSSTTCVSKHVEPTLIEPTILHDYPVELSPFAKRHREHEGLVERFEAFADGMEFANAFSELNDPDDQRARFEEQVRHAAAGDEDAPPFDEDYIFGARARHAADRRDRHRHRPPDDAASPASGRSAKSSSSRP